MSAYTNLDLNRLSSDIVDKVRRDDPSLTEVSVKLLTREFWSVIASQNDVIRKHLSKHLQNLGETEMAEKLRGTDMPGDYEWPVASERPQR